MLALLTCFVACEDANEKHEKYLEIGSPVFAGKLDSIKSYPGFYRVKIAVYPSVDVNRKELRVYWNNYQDSVVMQYSDEFKNDQGWYETTIEKFEEGNIEGYRTFFFRNYDNKGNRSKTSESIVQIYGNDFAKALNNQAYAGFDGSHFNLQSREYTAGLEVKYTQEDGSEITKKFTSPVTQLKVIGIDPDLPNFKSNTAVQYRTIYKFSSMDIDSVTVGYWSSTNNIVLPDPLILDQENIFRYIKNEAKNQIKVDVWEGEDWEASCLADWVTLEKVDNNQKLEVSLTENTTGEKRSTEVVVHVVGKTGSSYTKTIPVEQLAFSRLESTKANWSELVLPDNSGTGYGWTLPHLWNGTTGGTGYHTEGSDRAPYLMSFDLGEPVAVEYFEIFPRSAHGRAAVDWEVWASNEGNEVGVEKGSEEWETKAVEAGWKKVATYHDDNWNKFRPVAAKLNDQTPYRYLRLRVTKNSIENNAYNLMEVSIIGMP
jgi:predicted secreted protein